MCLYMRPLCSPPCSASFSSLCRASSTRRWLSCTITRRRLTESTVVSSSGSRSLLVATPSASACGMRLCSAVRSLPSEETANAPPHEPRRAQRAAQADALPSAALAVAQLRPRLVLLLALALQQPPHLGLQVLGVRRSSAPASARVPAQAACGDFRRRSPPPRTCSMSRLSILSLSSQFSMWRMSRDTRLCVERRWALGGCSWFRCDAWRSGGTPTPVPDMAADERWPD